MKKVKQKTSAVRDVKEDKLFFKADVFVYFGLALVILCLFLIFFFPKSCAKDNFSTFSVYSGDSVVLTFDCEKDNPLTISEDFLHLVEHEINGDEYIITVYTSIDKDGFNKIVFNRAESSAKVIESTCSASKDCVYAPKLTAAGSIYCAPHTLKIVKGSGLTPPVVG